MVRPTDSSPHESTSDLSSPPRISSEMSPQLSPELPTIIFTDGSTSRQHLIARVACRTRFDWCVFAQSFSSVFSPYSSFGNGPPPDSWKISACLQCG